MGRAFRHLPLLEADLAATGRTVPFYREWLQRDVPGDPHWGPLDFSSAIPRLQVPISIVGGWYDYYLPYMLDDYRRCTEAGMDVQLTIGPWPHLSLEGMLVGLREALAWFDIHLRGDAERRRRAPVRVKVMGSGEWRDLERWPPAATTQRWHLQAGGRLGPSPPGGADPDRYRYDPADPTPAVGGTSLSPNSGPRDNRALERRQDVLTYTSEPLLEEKEILGNLSAGLFVGSSLEHTDFFVRLCDVTPLGRSINVSDGLVRLGPGEPPEAAGGVRHIQVELWPTAYRVRRRHRLRVQVSSGAHPRYARNLGTGETLAAGIAMRAADQAVYHDPAHPSGLLIPVAVPADPPLGGRETGLTSRSEPRHSQR